MGVGGRLLAERAQDHHLARGVRDVVLAAHDLRDAHVAVVDRDREVVERAAVGAADHEVVDRRVREADVAADLVVDDGLALVRHPQAHRALVLVGVPAGEQLLDRRGVRRGPLGLRDRPLVPVELEPAQGVEDLLHVLRGRALAVGVLDAQDELAARAPREQPVVQCRPRAAYVQDARGRWSETNPHPPSMLIGAHVSTAGGLVQAHERGMERGCEAIQVFNQSPRQWRPTRWKPDDVAALPRADEGRPDRVGHDPRRLPDQPGDQGPRDAAQVGGLARARAAHGRRDRRRRRGRAPRVDGGRAARGGPAARRRDGRATRCRSPIAAACCSRTPPAPGNTLGRSFEELRELVDLSGGDRAHRDLPRLLPPARQRLRRAHARTSWRRWSTSYAKVVGMRRLRCLHLNDSQTPLGSNRDRHAPPGDGELGPARLRRVPVGAALREAAGAVRGARAWRARPPPRSTSTGCASSAPADCVRASGAGAATAGAIRTRVVNTRVTDPAPYCCAGLPGPSGTPMRKPAARVARWDRRRRSPRGEQRSGSAPRREQRARSSRLRCRCPTARSRAGRRARAG